MPITLHALLRGFASIVGFFSGGFVGAGVYALLSFVLVDGIGIDVDSPPVMVPRMIFAAIVFFGGAILGLKLGGNLVVRYVPAHCRACGGRAYPYYGKEIGKQVAYQCRGCSQVNLTPFYETRGS